MSQRSPLHPATSGESTPLRALTGFTFSAAKFRVCSLSHLIRDAVPQARGFQLHINSVLHFACGNDKIVWPCA